MEFWELLGLGKELRALLIPVFVGMRLGKELEFSLGWFLGKLRLPDPGFSFGSCRGKVGKRIPRDRGMFGWERLGAHPIPWAIPAHPNPIPAAFPWSCRWNSGRKRALGVGNCSFPAHSRPFSRELLIRSSFPALFPGIAHSQPLSLDLEIPGLAVPSRGHSRSFGISPLPHS